MEIGEKRAKKEDGRTIHLKVSSANRLTYAELTIVIEEISEVWPTRSQKREALEKLVKKRKEKK